jgi:hypothetical protein
MLLLYIYLHPYKISYLRSAVFLVPVLKRGQKNRDQMLQWIKSAGIKCCSGLKEQGSNVAVG